MGKVFVTSVNHDGVAYNPGDKVPKDLKNLDESLIAEESDFLAGNTIVVVEGASEAEVQALADRAVTAETRVTALEAELTSANERIAELEKDAEEAEAAATVAKDEAVAAALAAASDKK